MKGRQVQHSKVGPLSLALVASLIFSGCETVQTTQPGAVGVTREQRMAISAEQVEAAAVQQYRQMLQQAAAKGILNRDPAQVDRVRTVVTRLVRQVPAFRPEATGWNWEANVFELPEINAFCMAGGKIGIYAGLLERLRLTDDELAAVIGHEMAHALREHVREQVSRQVAQQLPLAVLAAVTGNEGLAQLGDLLADVTFGLPRSRQAELEADRIGVELAARAGYDPRAAVSLWRKMREAGGSGPPAFLSTHPSPADREEVLQRTAETVLPLYRQSASVR